MLLLKLVSMPRCSFKPQLRSKDQTCKDCDFTQRGTAVCTLSLAATNRYCPLQQQKPLCERLELPTARLTVTRSTNWAVDMLAQSCLVFGKPWPSNGVIVTAPAPCVKPMLPPMQGSENIGYVHQKMKQNSSNKQVLSLAATKKLCVRGSNSRPHD